MGRIKARLLELESTGRTFEISKWTPTTKACPICGSINTGITLKDRVYKCDCGYEYDRDIHAARNVKMFGSTKRTECLEQASAENSSSTSLLVEMSVNIPPFRVAVVHFIKRTVISIVDAFL